MLPQAPTADSNEGKTPALSDAKVRALPLVLATQMDSFGKYVFFVFALRVSPYGTSVR